MIDQRLNCFVLWFVFQFALLCFFVCIFLLSKNLDTLLWIVNLKEFSSLSKRGVCYLFTRYLKMIIPWNEKTDRRIEWQKSLKFNYSNRYASLLFPALLLFLKYNAAFLTGYSGNDSEPPFDTNRPTLNTKRPTLVSNRLVLLTNRLALLTNPPILLTDRSILLTNRLVLLTDRPILLTNRHILLTNRHILLTNRPQYDTIPVTIIAIRRIILCCFSIAIDYRLTIRHRQRINHANEVSIFQKPFFFAKT